MYTQGSESLADDDLVTVVEGQQVVNPLHPKHEDSQKHEVSLIYLLQMVIPDTSI